MQLEDIFWKMDAHKIGITGEQKKAWLLNKLGDHFKDTRIANRVNSKETTYDNVKKWVIDDELMAEQKSDTVKKAGVLLTATETKELRCHNCRGKGHFQRDCRSMFSFCYTCDVLTDHISTNCLYNFKAKRPRQSDQSNYSGSSRHGESKRHTVGPRHVDSARRPRGTRQTDSVKRSGGTRQSNGNRRTEGAQRIRWNRGNLGSHAKYMQSYESFEPENQKYEDEVGYDEFEPETNSALILRERGKLLYSNTENIENIEFIVDTGASDHIVKERFILDEISKLENPKRMVCAKSGEENDLIIREKGIFRTFLLHNTPVNFNNVLYGADVSENLISVRRLVEKDLEVHFNKYGVKVFDLHTTE